MFEISPTDTLFPEQWQSYDEVPSELCYLLSFEESKRSMAYMTMPANDPWEARESQETYDEFARGLSVLDTGYIQSVLDTDELSVASVLHGIMSINPQRYPLLDYAVLYLQERWKFGGNDYYISNRIF